MWVTLCGRLAVEVATRPDDVTCKLCLKRLARNKPSNADSAQYVEAVWGRRVIEFSPPPPIIDPLSDLPFLSPAVWITLRDRHHWCGHCAVCVWFTEMEALAHASPWQKRHGVKRAERFPSVKRAVEWYLERRLPGSPLKAQDPSRIGRLGTLIQGGVAADSMADSDTLHTIEVALDWAYRKPCPRGLTRNERLSMLFGASRGVKAHVIANMLQEQNPAIEKLTGPIVAAYIRDGEWTVYEGLRERGMVVRW